MKENLYQTAIMHCDCGFALHEIQTDNFGNPKDLLFLEINGSFEQLSGLDSKRVQGKGVNQILRDVSYMKRDWISFLYQQIDYTSGSRVIEINSKELLKSLRVKTKIHDGIYLSVLIESIKDIEPINEGIEEHSKDHLFLLDHMPQGVVYHNSEGKIFYANKSAADILGLTIDQLYGKTSMDPRWKSIKEDGTDYTGENHPAMLTLKTGNPIKNAVMGVFNPLKEEHIWININSIPRFRPTETKPYQAVVTYEDITERIQLERSIKESEANLKATIENSVENIWSIDKGYKIRYINELFIKSFQETFGKRLGRGVNIIEVLPEPLRQIWKDRYDRALRNEQFVFFEEVPIESSKVYIETAMNPIVVSGEVVGVSCYGKDITKRNETENSLLIFKESLENSSDAIGMSTTNWTHYYQNKAFDELFGRIEAKPTEVYLDKAIGDEVYRTIMSGKKWEGEIQMYDKDREVRDIFLRAYANKDKNGNITNLVGIHTDISKRKKVERDLIEKNFFINSLLHAVPVAVFYKDILGRYIGCNEVFTEIMGVTPEQIAGKTVYELWPSADAETYHQKDIELLQNPNMQRYEYHVTDQYGNSRPVIYAKDVFYDATGKPAGIVGAFIDISEIKNTEQKLHDKEANLKAIIENSLESIWSVDQNYRIQYVNEVFAKSFMDSFGVHLEQGMDIVEKTPQAIKPFWKERYDRVFKNEHFLFEDRIETEIGPVFVEVAMNPIVVDGVVTGASIYGKNVTNQRLAEESLKQSLERNQALLNANPDLMFVFDDCCRFVDYHCEDVKNLFLSPELFLNKKVEDVLPKYLADICHTNVMKVLTTGEQAYSTYELEVEGRIHYFESRYVKCSKNEVMSIVRDITNRKLAEMALSESEEKYRLLAENITDVIWTMDLNGKYQYVSPSVISMRGYTPEENMQQSFDETLTPESAKFAYALLADATKKLSTGIKPDPQVFTMEQRCKDGSTVWTEIMMSGVFDEKDELKYLLGVTRDISKRKKAEDELIKQSELRQLLVDISTGYINLPIENIEESINVSLEKISRFSEADRCYVFDFNNATERCTNIHEWCNKDIEPQIALLQDILLPKRWINNFREGKTIFIADVSELERGDERSILEPQAIKSLIVVPMMNQNLCIGFVGFDYVNKNHSYSSIEQQLLSVFAEMLVNIKLKMRSEEELIKAKEIAEENENRLTQIADNLSNGMIYQVVAEGDDHRRFTYISNKVEEFYGCSIEEAKLNADLIYSRIHPDDIRLVIDGEREALKDFKIFQTVARMINPDGTIRWSYFVSSPRRQNEKLMWDGIEIDISSQKQVENELIAAKEKAEESDRLKSVFLANVSHEIRTPMNAILGFLGLLKEPDLKSDRINDYIDIVNQSGQRLLHTINDIIEISKIEAGQIEVVSTIVNSMEMMHFHYDLFKRQADQKGIQLKLSEYIKGEQAYIRTDKNKLEGILTNLINNAIKFTFEGSIEFGNYLEDEFLVFYVKDTGIGIPENRKKAIFERFVQADIKHTRPHEGSGLGLSIVKAYVEMLKGKIILESEVGKGSTFRLYIPYYSSEVLRVKEALVSRTIGIRHKQNLILIAEDDDFSFKFFEDSLRNEGLKIIRAVNGEEVISSIRENRDISLVLMDIKMPGKDGLEATREIRTFDSKIPIIAQTAYAFTGDKEKALEAGCNDYISKPIKLDELIEILNKYL
jgi:PAS domain S-box-containing protein